MIDAKSQLIIEQERNRKEPEIRNELYYALKDTRNIIGNISIKKIASIISTALSREEISALVNQLNRNLDA